MRHQKTGIESKNHRKRLTGFVDVRSLKCSDDFVIRNFVLGNFFLKNFVVIPVNPHNMGPTHISISNERIYSNDLDHITSTDGPMKLLFEITESTLPYYVIRLPFPTLR